jgi:CubicO group peptidase (beta-lactamase class C family)
MDQEKQKRIDDLFELWQRGVCPGGQVAVKHKGELIYDRCFGYANIELGVKVSDESVFHVASVSKQLTVIAVMLLHEDGKLNIDDDIRKYIPEHIHFPQAVTIRNMMTNVSGIRDIWTLQMLRGTRIDDTITQQDAVTIIANQTGLNFEPEERYLYSNSNFVLLAEIAEKVSGKSLNDFLQERVFTPLGMTSTVIRDRYWQLIPNRATSYRDMADGFTHNVLNYGSYGSTSLHTTAKDFLKWLNTFRKPAICKPETIAEMMLPTKLSNGTTSPYGGGIFCGDLEGYKYAQHGGADASFRSYSISFYEDDLDIVVFSNTANLPPGNLAMSIARIVFDLDEPEAKQSERYCEEFDAKEAVGFYYTAPHEIMGITISECEGKLYVQDSYGKIPLTNLGGNKYKAASPYAAFLLGKNAALVAGNDEMPLIKADETAKESECLLAYEGTYVSDEVDTVYNVYENEGVLYLDHFRNYSSRLYRHKRDYYIAGGPFSFGVEFMRGSAGEVLGFKFHSGRVYNLGFTKID